ncbi:MAG: group III truncated hemoglobin [Hyphomonadaceae bacterium]|jgi:hemoglobin|nr:group III truncated hemoglobin [Hyphomonadaceae bacterium]HOY78495.1 group III truncated hemoglobin [Hyphomonadaceae bacterium]
MGDPVVTAHARRAEIQRRANVIGIDEAYISLLVDEFYRRIRADETLGPIFEEAIGDRWDYHLPRMKSFWASVALNAGTYSGQPVPAHKKLSQVEQSHFQTWLALFRQTLQDTAPTPEAVDYFMERANRIAESLQLAMFGFPGLPVKRQG